MSGRAAVRRYGATLGLILAGITSDAAAQSGPSFDCAKATTVVEKAICDDAAAASADRAMADAYRRLLETLAAPAARGHLQRDQTAWLADRQPLCAPQTGAPSGRTLPICLRDVATARAERLAALPRGNDYAFVGERRLVERGRRGGVAYDIAVSYAVFAFHGVDSSPANATIKAWADEIAADVRPPTQAMQGGAPDIGWFLDSGHVVHVAARELVTVAAHWLMFTGGAHPNNGRVAWHVEPTTGRVLTLGDILGSGWQDAVTELARADLTRQFVERPGFDGSLAPAALRKMVTQPRRWIFARERAMLTFDPYDVAPYAAGPYEVELSYTALAPYIRRNGPLGSRAR